MRFKLAGIAIFTAAAVSGAMGAMPAHAAAPVATLKVANISVTSMQPVDVWGTLANPSVLGPNGDAQWNLAKNMNTSPTGLWYLYPGHTRDSATSWFPGLDDLGTWHGYPAGATYVDANFNSHPVAQNTVTFYIKQGAGTTVRVTRSGKVVAVSAYVKRYNDRLDFGLRGAWQPWVGHWVSIQQYRGGKWVLVKSMVTGKNGWTRTYKFVYQAKRLYRAQTSGTATIWGATSATVAR